MSVFLHVQHQISEIVFIPQRPNVILSHGVTTFNQLLETFEVQVSQLHDKVPQKPPRPASRSLVLRWKTGEVQAGRAPLASPPR